MSEIGQLTPGTKCDRYDIVRLIGAGGMGEVYQGMHEFTKKQVALKVLKLAHAAKEHHVEKMRAEAMVLCRIRHQNLVEVYDAGIADVQTATGGLQSLIWMAMEMLEGESLRERLMREGALRPALALEWAAQIADGIQAAHDAQVVHRDLKPENIFITKKGDIRVLDFGTAKFDGMGHRPTRQQDRVGTIPYMSPEHLNGDELDGRSDIYALGFILYEMLAGRHPFSDAQGGFPPLDQLLPMALTAEPESLAGHIGESVWHVVTRSVDKDRDTRFASMKEASAAYRQVAKAYGTDTSGVALRLSGSSPNNPVPAIVADASGRMSAVPAAGGSFANLTPPPLAAGIPQETASGVTGGALAGMAVAAAAVGALVVVLISGPIGAAPTKTSDDTVTASPGPTDTPTPSETATSKAALDAAPPTPEAPAPPTPDASATAKTAKTAEPVATPTPRQPVRPLPRPGRAQPPPQPPAAQPVIKPCTEIVCDN